MRWKPRLRTVLLVINLFIILLPLGGIGILRLYEGELVRRTETELIGQGNLLAEAFRLEMLKTVPAEEELTTLAAPRIAARPPGDPDGKYHPIPPRLDVVREDIRPPAPDPSPPGIPPDPAAVAAARRVMTLLDVAKDVTLVGIRIVDRNGVVVASTGKDAGLSLLLREEVARALKGEHVSLLRQRFSDDAVPPPESLSRGKRVRVFVAVPVMEKGRVLGAVSLSRTPLDIRKALFIVRDQIYVAAAVLMGVLLLVTLMTSLTLTKPISELISRTNRIVAGEKGASAILSKPGTRELEELSTAVSAMAGTLEKRADYIRSFAANVSHEFKTPLASIKGTVELLQDHIEEMTAQERGRFLENLAGDAARLDLLVRRLLELARADTVHRGDERTSLHGLLREIADRFTASGLPVSVEVPPGLTASVSAEALETAVFNLIENSRHHGGAGVSVALRAEPGDGVVDLYVSDTGIGIPEGSRDKIFRPFFTTARERGGTGLGLSIVETMIKAHGGSVSLQPSESGASFLIRLPA